MKRILTLISLVYVLSLTAQQTEWVHAYGDSGDDFTARAITTDDSGNVYAFGTYVGTLTVGSSSIVNSNISTPMPFWLKLDNHGNPLWVRDYPGCFPISAIAYENQRIYVGGGRTVDNLGSFCVSAYDLEGNQIYQDNIASGEVRSMMAKSDHAVVAGGNFEPSIYGYYSTIGIADAQGIQNWGVTFGNGNDDLSTESAGFDEQGNILVAGYFKYRLTLVDSFGTTPTILNAGGINDYDLFLAKYSSDGHLLSAMHDSLNLPQMVSAPTPGSWRGDDIRLKFDHQGNLFIMTSYGQLLKYNKQLQQLWKKNTLVQGVGLITIAWDISPDDKTLVIGSGLNMPCFFNNSGSMQYYVLDSAGNDLFNGSIFLGCTGQTHTGPYLGLSINKAKDIYFTGDFFGTGNFDSLTLTSNQSSNDVSLGKISGCNITPPQITELNHLLQSSPAASYQWFLNGDIIPGATAQTYTPAESGVYTVQTSDGMCQATSSGYSFVLTSISQMGNLPIGLYPNPSTNKICLNDLQTPFTYELFDVTSRMIYSEKQLSKSEIDVSLLSPGTYFLNITTTHGRYSAKFIKE